MMHVKSFAIGALVACAAAGGNVGCIGGKNSESAKKVPVASVNRAETTGQWDLAGLAPSMPNTRHGTQPVVETILGRRFEFKLLASVIDGRDAHSLQITGDDIVMTFGDWVATNYEIQQATVTFGPFSIAFTGEPRHYIVNDHAVELAQFGWFTLDPNGQALRLH